MMNEVFRRLRFNLRQTARGIEQIYWLIQKTIESEVISEVHVYPSWPTLKYVAFARGKTATPRYWCRIFRRTKTSISFSTPPAYLICARAR